MLAIFIELYFWANQDKKERTEVFGPSYADLFKSIYYYFTNLNNELLLVAAFVYIGIGPQFLTYFLSGLSGSASPPKFVRQISMIATWSLVKFMAALSGILLAHPILNLLISKGVSLSEFLPEWLLFHCHFY